MLEITKRAERIRCLSTGHLIPGALSANAADNKVHPCVFGMAPHAEPQLAAAVETLFRSSPVSNRNNVWFVCSKVNTKGFSFQHQMPAELFSALLDCHYLSLAFPPQGKFREVWFDWQLKNDTVERGASRADAGVFQLHLTLLNKWSPEIPKLRKNTGFLMYLELCCLWGCA